MRSWLLALCACAIAAFAVSTAIVVHGGQESLRLVSTRLGADVAVVPRGAATEVDGALLMGTVSRRWLPSADVARIAALHGVAVASPQIYLESLSHASCCAVSHIFIAFDPRTDFTVQPWLKRALGGDLGLQQAVGGSDVSVPADRNIMLYGYDMWMRGRLEPTGTKLDQSLFISMPTAEAMARASRTAALKPLVIPRDRVSSVMVKVVSGEDPVAVAGRIERAVPGVKAVARPQMFATYRAQIAGLLRLMLVILGLLLALSLVVMALLLSMAAHERRRGWSVPHPDRDETGDPLRARRSRAHSGRRSPAARRPDRITASRATRPGSGVSARRPYRRQRRTHGRRSCRRRTRCRSRGRCAGR